MSKNRSVIASQKHIPVHSLDDKGKSIKVGEVRTTMYQGEDVWRNDFIGGLDTEPKQLKSTNRAWVPFDHKQTLKPLFDAGWEASNIKLMNGGRKMWGLFNNPKGESLKDIFDWDAGFYPPGTTQQDGGIQSGIIVTSEISPNRSSRYQLGFFRVVCANGLVTKALGLADVRVNANNKDEISLANELFGKVVMSEDVLRGPKIGHKKGVIAFSKFLRNYYEDAEFITHAPPFVQEMTHSFGNIPHWMGLNAVQQFEAMVNMKGKPHSGDVVNAWTNAINYNPNDEEERSTSRGLRKLDVLTKNASDLISVYSM